MSDFYAVLKQSIVDRELRSEDERDAAYAEARAAIVRRLWSYDPPLSEDEIDDRIGHFDLAVERMEREIVEVFADDPAPPQGAAATELIEPPPPVYDDPDDEAGDLSRDETPILEPEDVAANGGNSSADGSTSLPATRRRESIAELFLALDARSLAVEQALNGQPEEPVALDIENPAALEPSLVPDHPDLSDAEPQSDLLPAPAPAEEQAFSDDGDALLAADEPVDWHRPGRPAPAPPARKRESPPRRPTRAVKPRRSTRAVKPHRASISRRDAETRKVRGLIVAVAALAAALIAALIYVLAPLYFGDSDPVLAGPGEDPGTTGSVSQSADSLQRFTLFDGGDPTVFKAGPGNPVRFSGEAARISTSAGSAGASVAIGPGLAARLAGHNVRVTVMARTVRENGALNLRIAYQSGLAISHWRTANLTSDLAPVELEWRVPTLRTDPSGGAIIIEPGIPGDGTAAEITAITIDVLD